MMINGRNPWQQPQQQQTGPTSSGGWNGGAPLQQQPATPTPPRPGQVAMPFSGGGGMAAPGGGGANPFAGVRTMPQPAAPATGGGGSSYLSLLGINPPGNANPRRGMPPTPAAPTPTDAPAVPAWQQMQANTAAGNQLTAANKLSHLEDGIPNSALYRGGQLIGGSYLKEGVPMAAHLGSANGSLVAGGGGGGAGGGAGGSSGVGDALQKSMDQANAANEQRYRQLLQMSGQLSDAGMQRETQTRDNELGRVSQDAISAGLGNSTVLPTLEKGVYDQSALRQQEIGDQGLKTAMGIVERRTDQGPDYAALASMAARPGATGGGAGYGGGFSLPSSGAGYGGGGAGGMTIGQLMHPGGGPANQAAMYAQLLKNAQQPAGDGFTSSNQNGYGHQVPDGWQHAGSGYSYDAGVASPADEGGGGASLFNDSVYDATGMHRDKSWMSNTY